MKSIVVFALLLLASTVSHANQVAPPAAPELPTAYVAEPPKAWSMLAGLSKTIADSTSEAQYFGDEAATSGAIAYGRADHGALYLSWVDSVRPIPGGEEITRQAFDSLHEAPYVASPVAGSTQEISYREHNVDGVAEMSFEWAHLSNETVNMVRALSWKDTDSRMHMLVAECVYHNEAVNESRPLCEAALGAVHLSASAKHVALTTLDAPKEIRPAAQAAPVDPKIPELKTGTGGDQGAPTLSPPPAGGQGKILYDGRGPKTVTDNKNKLFIGIGVVLLAAAFWLTTRAKARSTSDEDDAQNEEEQGQ